MTTSGSPTSSGRSPPIVNSGIVDNHGVEFEIGWNGHIGQHFRYYIRPNFTFARNKIKYCNEISYIDNNGRDCPWRYQTGKRLDENFCYIFDHFVADQGGSRPPERDERRQRIRHLGPRTAGRRGLQRPQRRRCGQQLRPRSHRQPPVRPRSSSAFRWDSPTRASTSACCGRGSALCSVQLSGPAVWDFPLYDQSRIGKVRGCTSTAGRPKRQLRRNTRPALRHPQQQ